MNYRHIAEAIEYYAGKNYKQVDAPWVVGKKAINLTTPKHITNYPVKDNGYLVASGEQSFLQLILDGKLEKGRWACTTACFRDDEVDDLHKSYFMKVELINTLNTSLESLEEVIELACGYFNLVIPGCHVIKTNPKDPLLVENTARDILSPQNIELGSYGIREHPDVGRWIYATGCAEPRLSFAKSKEM